MTEKNDLNQNIKLICNEIAVLKNDSRCTLACLYFSTCLKHSDETVFIFFCCSSCEVLKYIMITDPIHQVSGCVNV